MKNILTIALLLGALFGSVIMFTMVTSPAYAADTNTKMTICHGTGSTTHPYNVITVSTNAMNGHFNTKDTPRAAHDDDVMGSNCPSATTTPKPTTTPQPTVTPTPTSNPEDEKKGVIPGSDQLVQNLEKKGAVAGVSKLAYTGGDDTSMIVFLTLSTIALGLGSGYIALKSHKIS